MWGHMESREDRRTLSMIEEVIRRGDQLNEKMMYRFALAIAEALNSGASKALMYRLLRHSGRVPKIVGLRALEHLQAFDAAGFIPEIRSLLIDADWRVAQAANHCKEDGTYAGWWELDCA